MVPAACAYSIRYSQPADNGADMDAPAAVTAQATRLHAAARACAIWLLGSLLAFSGVLGLEALRHLRDASAVGQLAYLSRLAALCTLAFSGPPRLLHVLRAAVDHLAQRHRPGERPPGASEGDQLTTWLVAALAAYPSWLEADFLTSGSAVSELPYEDELRYALCAGLVLGYATLWRWHLLGITARARTRTREVLWFACGALVLALLYELLSYELKAYAFFAQALVPPAWFIASTLGYRALAQLRAGTVLAASAALALGAGAFLLGELAPEQVARARNGHMRRGKIAALSDLMVYPSDTELASLNARPPSDFQCKPHPSSRTLEPLAIAEEQRRNVLLISIDALRKDALRWKHDKHRVMPKLAAFAGQSLRYERAVTTYPATLIAVAGALTGLNASQILFSPTVPDNLFALARARIPRQRVSLPDSRWFRKKVVEPLFVQGAELQLQADAKAQTDWLIGELRAARKHKEPLLAWVHYYEPHQDYELHPGYEFGGGSKGRYMSELGYVDAQLGRLFSYLERGHYLENSLVIVFADHGEAMGELDYEGHHVYLNSWITDIPLLVRAPGFGPAASQELADITDVAVTVLHFLGLPVPWESDGMSLLAPEAARRTRVSFAEAFPIRGDRLFKLANRQVKNLEDYEARMDRIHRGAKNYLPKVSAVSADYRLIVNRVTDLEELYDRRRDPEEQHDLSLAHLPAHAALRKRLAEWSAEQAELLYCKVRQQPGAE
jgi:arylsulfatase A-like enzyme